MAGWKNCFAGVHAYLTASATTTITTADTFQFIVGTFDNNPIEGFHIGVNGIVCDVSDWYEIGWNAAFGCNPGNRTVHMGVAINDEVITLISPSVMGEYIKTLNEPTSMSGGDVKFLNAGDSVQLQVTSSGTGDEIQVDHYIASISKFMRK